MSRFLRICVLSWCAMLAGAGKCSGQQVLPLVPLHPAVGHIEAVGSGSFGRSLVRFGMPLFYSSNRCVVVGFAESAGDGVLEIVYYRVDGSQAGVAVPIRQRDLRQVRSDQGSGEVGETVSTFGSSATGGNGSLLQLDAAPYLLAAPVDAYSFQIRSTPFSTITFNCNGGVLCGGCFVVALVANDDGVPGSVNPSEILDQRFQIVRERGELSSAVVFYDNSTWYAELRLTFSLPTAGPAGQAQAALADEDVLWTRPDGLQPVMISNPNDTNAMELQAGDLQIGALAGPYVSLGSGDVSSFSIIPGTQVLSVYFDRKFSRLWSPTSPLYIRCSPNSNVRDAFGNRVRSNEVQVQYISCPSAPSPFQTLTPAPDAQAVSSTTTLTWADAVCRASYTLKVATDAAMTNLVIDTGTTGTSFSLASSPLGLNQRYYWQVTATNVNGSTTNLGGVQTFRTLIPGDLNADGLVNVADLTAFLGNFGTTVP